MQMHLPSCVVKHLPAALVGSHCAQILAGPVETLKDVGVWRALLSVDSQLKFFPVCFKRLVFELFPLFPTSHINRPGTSAGGLCLPLFFSQ